MAASERKSSAQGVYQAGSSSKVTDLYVSYLELLQQCSEQSNAAPRTLQAEIKSNVGPITDEFFQSERVLKHINGTTPVSSTFGGTKDKDNITPKARPSFIKLMEDCLKLSRMVLKPFESTVTARTILEALFSQLNLNVRNLRAVYTSATIIPYLDAVEVRCNAIRIEISAAIDEQKERQLRSQYDEDFQVKEQKLAAEAKSLAEENAQLRLQVQESKEKTEAELQAQKRRLDTALDEKTVTAAELKKKEEALEEAKTAKSLAETRLSTVEAEKDERIRSLTSQNLALQPNPHIELKEQNTRWVKVGLGLGLFATATSAFALSSTLLTAASMTVAAQVLAVSATLCAALTPVGWAILLGGAVVASLACAYNWYQKRQNNNAFFKQQAGGGGLDQSPLLDKNALQAGSPAEAAGVAGAAQGSPTHRGIDLP
jgi:hypothetical protein